MPRGFEKRKIFTTDQRGMVNIMMQVGSKNEFRCSPVARISDFHSEDPGSIPGSGIFCIFAFGKTPVVFVRRSKKFQKMPKMRFQWPQNANDMSRFA